jgi:hypothetical protein
MPSSQSGPAPRDNQALVETAVGMVTPFIYGFV